SHMMRYGARAGPSDRDASAYVFTAREGGQVRQGNWRERVFQPACRRARVVRTRADGRIEVPRPQDLRHTAASLAAASGYSLQETKEMLGHASVQLTSNTYLHLFENEKRQRADRLGTLIQVPTSRS